MDGIHDLGGKYGFGAVDTDDPGVGFHDRFEARVFAIMRATSAVGAMPNGDCFRHAIERIDPAAYLRHGYYGRWLGGCENLLVEADALTSAQIDAKAAQLGATPEEIEASRAAQPAVQPPRFAQTENSGSEREISAQAKFQIGDRVRTARYPVPGHTRLPAYARDRIGEVHVCHGAWVFPDTHAHGLGECPAFVYTVVFDGRELWGDAAEIGTSVRLDLWEPYLSAEKP